MIFGESRLKDVYRMLVWGPYRLALRATPAGTELAVNRALGDVACRLLPARRAELRARMAEVLGERPDLDADVQRAFKVHFANQYVGFTFPKMRAENFGHILTLTGVEHLDEALSKHKGAVLAHAHMAVPQLPLHVLGLCGYDVHQVGGGKTAAPLSLMGRRAAAIRARLEHDIEATLHDGRAYLRPVLRALLTNAVVFTACDGTGGGEEYGRRVALPVLGRSMHLPPFPAWLAARTGAALLPLSIRSTHDGVPYRAVIGAPLPCPDVDTGLRGLAAFLDAELRASPGDWHFWDAFHPGPGGLVADGV